MKEGGHRTWVSAARVERTEHSQVGSLAHYAYGAAVGEAYTLSSGMRVSWQNALAAFTSPKPTMQHQLHPLQLVHLATQPLWEQALLQCGFDAA